MFHKLYNKLHASQFQGLIILFLFTISLLCLAIYFPSRLNLPYADSISRLNISRKVVDNLTPGLAQLGSVWLPLPQLLMLPFIWNEFMWRSGLAGAVMSSAAFIIGGYYIYKSAYLISKSFLPSFFTLCIYALNINVLFLQTTAMSECLFMALMAAVIYYLLKWVNTDQRRFLIFAGVALSGVTLIRYEGLALLLATTLMAVVYMAVKYKSYKRTEGSLILYACIAFLGFGLWTLYLTAIFGDPLFWLRYYGFGQTQTPGAGLVTHSQSKPFLAAVWQYFTSITWMSGIIPVIFAGIGLLLSTFLSLQKRSWNIVVLLLPFSVFLLMVLTLMRNTPIVQPDLTVANILSTHTSLETGFNIRYGVMLLPWIALLSVYVFNLKKPLYLPTLFFFAIFLIQFANHFHPVFTPVYEIPMALLSKPDQSMVDWLKNHYDKGYILISASGFEDQMFMFGFPYRTYIHEGAGKYWKESLDRPARYADWIVIDFSRESDALAKEFKSKNSWNWDYDLVWEERGSNVKIYKIKTHPDIIIPR